MLEEPNTVSIPGGADVSSATAATITSSTGTGSGSKTAKDKGVWWMNGYHLVYIANSDDKTESGKSNNQHLVESMTEAGDPDFRQFLNAKDFLPSIKNW